MEKVKENIFQFSQKFREISEIKNATYNHIKTLQKLGSIFTSKKRKSHTLKSGKRVGAYGIKIFANPSSFDTFQEMFNIDKCIKLQQTLHVNIESSLNKFSLLGVYELSVVIAETAQKMKEILFEDESEDPLIGLGNFWFSKNFSFPFITEIPQSLDINAADCTIQIEKTTTIQELDRCEG